MKNRIRIFYQRTSDFKYCINVNQTLQSIFLHAHATFISIFEYQFFKLYVKKLSIFHIDHAILKSVEKKLSMKSVVLKK